MQLCVVRHGMTDYNLNGYVQGRINVPLHAKGKKQAHILGQLLRQEGYVFDCYASSPLSRSIETLYWIQQELKTEAPIQIVPRFAERDFAHMDGRPVDEVMPLVRQPNYEALDYETDKSLIKRIYQGTMDLYHRHANQTMLMVAHSHVIKSLLILSNPKTYTFADFIGHTEMFIFEVTHQHIELVKRVTP